VPLTDSQRRLLSIKVECALRSVERLYAHLPLTDAIRPTAETYRDKPPAETM